MDSTLKETNKTLVTCSTVCSFSAHGVNGTLSQAIAIIVQLVLVIVSSQKQKICGLKRSNQQVLDIFEESSFRRYLSCEGEILESIEKL